VFGTLAQAIGRSTASLFMIVAPQLRTKGADAVIEQFLSEDAVLPSSLARGMSRFAALRVIDRLVELGAVRELTGRETFRLYGL
jgi:Protein of unknown function (DUF1403)